MVLSTINLAQLPSHERTHTRSQSSLPINWVEKQADEKVIRPLHNAFPIFNEQTSKLENWHANAHHIVNNSHKSADNLRWDFNFHNQKKKNPAFAASFFFLLFNFSRAFLAKTASFFLFES